MTPIESKCASTGLAYAIPRTAFVAVLLAVAVALPATVARADGAAGLPPVTQGGSQAGGPQNGPLAGPSASKPWPEIKQGASGERVRTIQLLLNQHAVQVKVDGEFGPRTLAAVKQFQRIMHMPVNGEVTGPLWAKLIVPLRQSARGDGVTALQHQLRYQYGEKVGVDGVFGSLTTAAVKQFQRRAGLAVDGVVGTLTWHALEAGN